MKTQIAFIISIVSLVTTPTFAADSAETQAGVAIVGSCAECSLETVPTTADFLSQIGDASAAVLAEQSAKSKVRNIGDFQLTEAPSQVEDPTYLDLEMAGPEKLRIPKGANIKVGNGNLTLGKSRKELIKYQVQFD